MIKYTKAMKRIAFGGATLAALSVSAVAFAAHHSKGDPNGWGYWGDTWLGNDNWLHGQTYGPTAYYMQAFTKKCHWNYWEGPPDYSKYGYYVTYVGPSKVTYGSYGGYAITQHKIQLYLNGPGVTWYTSSMAGKDSSYYYYNPVC